MILPCPQGFLRRDQPAEVPRRTGIPRGTSRRQQPLGRDPTRRLVHPRGHQLGPPFIVAAPPRPHRRATTGLVPLDHPLHGLRRGAAERSRPTKSAHLTVGRNDVHPFPRSLQWKLPGGDSDWLTPPPSPPRAHPPGRHDERGMGTFTWPPARTSTWPPAGTFSWPWTIDGRNVTDQALDQGAA